MERSQVRLLDSLRPDPQPSAGHTRSHFESLPSLLWPHHHLTATVRDTACRDHPAESTPGTTRDNNKLFFKLLHIGVVFNAAIDIQKNTCSFCQ